MFTVVQLQGATLWALLEMITHNGWFCIKITDQQHHNYICSNCALWSKNQNRTRENCWKFFSSIRAEIWLNGNILRCSCRYINEAKSTSGFFTLVPTFLMRFYLLYSIVRMIHFNGYCFSNTRKIGIAVSVCHPQHLSSGWQLTRHGNCIGGQNNSLICVSMQNN